MPLNTVLVVGLHQTYDEFNNQPGIIQVNCMARPVPPGGMREGNLMKRWLMIKAGQRTHWVKSKNSMLLKGIYRSMKLRTKQNGSIVRNMLFLY